MPAVVRDRGRGGLSVEGFPYRDAPWSRPFPWRSMRRARGAVMFLSRTVRKRIIGTALGIYWVAMFIATHIPIAVPLPPGRDKWLHFVSYLILGLLFCAYRSFYRPVRLGRVLGTLLVLGTYAALDELLQIPVGRTADIRDWGADMAGVLTAIGVFQLARKVRRPR